MNLSLGTPITRRIALAALGSVAFGATLTSFPAYATDATGNRLAKLLPNFTPNSHSLLQRLLDDPSYSGCIPISEAASLAKFENVSSEQLMLNLLPLAQSYSHAPISNFFVGVVAHGASGALYTGANIEIPGQCLDFAVHAEPSALSNAYMHSERAVTALAVGDAPCGHCRQVINEMSPQGEILILTPHQPPRISHRFCRRRPALPI
jgi:cytidine deaminase